MKRWHLLLLWLATLLILTCGAVLAQEGTPTLQEQDSLWQILAPITAIATTVERALEVYWNRSEKKGLWPHKEGVPCPKEEDYVLHKQQMSHWLGTALAMIFVGLTNVRFFRLLGLEVLFAEIQLFDLDVGGILNDFTVGTLIDWILTAGVIGWGGTELVHQIIEALVKGRHLWRETKEVRAGEKNLLETELFYVYILPQLEELGISSGTLYRLIGLLRQAGVPLDDLVNAAARDSTDAFVEQLKATPEGAKIAEAIENLMESEGIDPKNLVQLPGLLNPLSPEVCKQLLGILPPQLQPIMETEES
ncbi:MAG: hypothetical protein ACP5GX_00505 [Anaerolineae bacterium]